MHAPFPSSYSTVFFSVHSALFRSLHRSTQSIPSFSFPTKVSLLPLAVCVVAALTVLSFNHTLSFSHSLRLNCATYSSICTLNTLFNTVCVCIFLQLQFIHIRWHVCVYVCERECRCWMHKDIYIDTNKQTHASCIAKGENESDWERESEMSEHRPRLKKRKIQLSKSHWECLTCVAVRALSQLKYPYRQ